MSERGATEEEVVTTVQEGEQFSAKFGRCGYRRNFAQSGTWRGRVYPTKQVEVYAAEEDVTIVVVTVIVKYF
ncbi:MAG: hypothetical protein K6U75_15685 [Firmicutes bacterium]|nr:hypothetical protein [Bacillota bacterium]